MKSSWFRPNIERMSGYVPGEQPQDSGWIKLNTNENPYPPSPHAFEAMKAAAERLRLYPDPMGASLRAAAARKHGVRPEMILAGNGSDDLLTIITRAFVGDGDIVVYPTPSYVLYKTLAELQDGEIREVPFREDWTLDPDAFAVPGAKLAFLANPNSPSGTVLPPAEVAKLAARLDAPLVVDEAYINFADSDCVGLVADHPNVIVTRTFSKGYALAGLRLGYLIARPEMVEGLTKVKDSYNCDALSLAGGTAALEDDEWLATTRSKIIATRERLAEAMRSFGCRVCPSQANFVWCEGGPATTATYQALKDRKILVRKMQYPGRPEGLRISVGTDAEVDRFLDALREIVRG